MNKEIVLRFKTEEDYLLIFEKLKIKDRLVTDLEGKDVTLETESNNNKKFEITYKKSVVKFKQLRL